MQRVSEQIERWEDVFRKYTSRQQELRTRGQWFSGPADLLSVIGRSRFETYHSAVLAWLLDPGAPHGLAAKFLGRFIAHCFPDLNIDLTTLTGTVTECEVARRRSRADIVIWCPDVTVVIEVKVDHVERANQCLDLYRDFHLEPDSHFIFLTPTGQKPKTAIGDSETAFRSLSFGAIRDMLRSLCDEANDDNSLPSGWQTMLCYLQTLEVEFP